MKFIAIIYYKFILLIIILILNIGNNHGIAGMVDVNDKGQSQPENYTETRKNLESLLARIESLEKQLSLYEAINRANCLIQLTKLNYEMGLKSAKSQGIKYFERGRNYAEILIHEYPSKIEGHYWLALNLIGICDQSETKGAMLARKLLPRIVNELQKSIEIDQNYDQAGAHRILGRIYYEAPAWPFSIGDLHKSLLHLEMATKIAPNNSTNRLFLAETFLRLGDKRHFRAEIDELLKTKQYSNKPQEYEDDRRVAKLLLSKYGGLVDIK